MVERDVRLYDMYIALERNRIDEVRRLLDEDEVLDINAKNRGDGRCVLMDAAERGALEAVELLVEHGADVHATMNQPEDIYVFQWPGMNALMFAIIGGHADVVRYLLWRGADTAAFDRQGLEKEYGQTALAYAAGEGKLAIVEMLLAAGADPDIRDNDGRTPLMMAAGRNRFEVVEQLLEYGADVRTRHNLGSTPMVAAASSGSIAMVEFLREKGAEIDARSDEGWTGLMSAALMGHIGILEYLLANGADVNQADAYGRTALILAAEGGHLAAVKRLVSAGADVNHRDKDGKTALTTAEQYHEKKVVKYLKKVALNRGS